MFATVSASTLSFILFCLPIFFDIEQLCDKTGAYFFPFDITIKEKWLFCVEHKSHSRFEESQR